jgi:hypothetical protein
MFGNDSQCYISVCDVSAGCVAQAKPDDTPCVREDPAYDPQCYTTSCQAGVCEFIGEPDATPCTATDSSKDPQCYFTECRSGVCTFVGEPGNICNDGDPCTAAPNVTDPLTGEAADQCVGTVTDVVCTGEPAGCPERPCFTGQCSSVGGGKSCIYTPLPYGTSCDDGVVCTTNDICEQAYFYNNETGQVEYRDTGECRGQVTVCEDPGDPCLVSRCLESEGGCVILNDVKNGILCELDGDNCTVDRCWNGTCAATDEPSPCPAAAAGLNKAAIAAGATVGAAVLLGIAALVALLAARRAKAAGVFDASTWDVAGAASVQSPLYSPLPHGSNPLYT